MKIKNLILISIVLTFAFAIVVSAAEYPLGANSVAKGQNDEFNESWWTSIEVNAVAGNVTELTITGVSQTNSWQGFYGEISGRITLDDASNNTMYDWSEAEPQGKIYASNSSVVTWADIGCFNYTSKTGTNLTHIETYFNIDDMDADGFNETFTDATNSQIIVGSIQIDVNTCPATNTYVNSAAQATEFEEILLSDGSGIIFTTIIENNQANNDTDETGYDGVQHDFQMLVAEDGHGTNVAVTPYYFFVEIE